MYVTAVLPQAARAVLEAEAAAIDAALKEIAEKAAASGQPLTWELLRGEPVRRIVAAARERAPDVTVLGTHGKAGTRAFWVGSVSVHVIRCLPGPFLLVPVRALPEGTNPDLDVLPVRQQGY